MSTATAVAEGSDAPAVAVPHEGQRDWFPGLDGLRGFLLLTLFSLHLPAPLVGTLKGGYTAMVVFFVLSGFLITTVLLREYERRGGVRLGHFYARRAVRLLPALFVFVVAVYALSYTDPFLKSHGADNRRQALSTLTYFYNWVVIHGFNRGSGAPGFLAHLWSLSVEEQFYLLWPGTLWLLMRRMARVNDRSLPRLARAAVPWLVTTIVLSNLARTTIGFVFENAHSYDRAYYGTDTMASGMLIGSLAAVVRIGYPALFARIRLMLPLVGWPAVLLLVGGVFVYPVRPNTFPFAGGFLLTELCGIVVILCLTERTLRPLNWICERRLIRWIGRIAYGAYVFHFMLIGRFAVYESRFRFEYETILAITIVLAGISFHVIEKPFATWARRRFRLNT